MGISINVSTYVQSGMAKVTRILSSVWDSICDHSDFAEHLDSIIRWNYIRPIRETSRLIRTKIDDRRYHDGAF